MEYEKVKSAQAATKMLEEIQKMNLMEQKGESHLEQLTEKMEKKSTPQCQVFNFISPFTVLR
jgi:hypothetical protein